MPYTPVGPFDDDELPALDADTFNHIEAGLVAAAAIADEALAGGGTAVDLTDNSDGTATLVVG
jgi:hypothetical protein